jgi:hypothetical protein
MLKSTRDASLTSMRQTRRGRAHLTRIGYRTLPRGLLRCDLRRGWVAHVGEAESASRVAKGYCECLVTRVNFVNVAPLDLREEVLCVHSARLDEGPVTSRTLR